MFFVIPVGVEGATLSRLPWVSIGIASACVAAFVATWVVPADPGSFAEKEVLEVLQYWNAHPWTEPSQAFKERFLADGGRLHDALQQWRSEAAHPSALDLELQQLEVDKLTAQAQEAADSNPLYRYSLVPDRGKVQLGWLTGLFLHFGWLHLLGNLLFFYMVGPLLEEAWGRLRFISFYLAGGLIAFAAQVAFQPKGIILGASGAIAASMGAFTLIYARQKVRLGYVLFVLFRPVTGTFAIPAWLWGLGWVAFEVFDLAIGANTNVAVMAHVAGFGFGLAVAGSVLLFFSAPAHAEPSASRHAAATPDPTEALRADQDAATNALRKALTKNPEDAKALFGLVRIDLEAGRRQAAMNRLERLVAMLTEKGEGERAAAMIGELGAAFDNTCLTPPTASALANALEKNVAQHQTLLEQLLEIAGRQRDSQGASALLRAAELRLERRDPSDKPLRLLASVRSLPQIHPSLLAKLAALEAQAGQLEDPLAMPSGSVSMRSAAPAAPRVRPCRLVQVGAEAITLESGGRSSIVPLSKILAVAASTVRGAPQPDQPSQGALYTDLVVDWGGSGAGPVVLRLDVPALDLEHHFPQVPKRLAYSRFLAHVMRQGARPLPDLQSLQQGVFRSYPDVASLDAALYGPW